MAGDMAGDRHVQGSTCPGIDMSRVRHVQGSTCPGIDIYYELGPRYRYGMFSQKSRAYDYRDPSILTLPKYNTITHGCAKIIFLRD